MCAYTVQTHVQLALCGQTPETALNSAAAAVQFFIQQTVLESQLCKQQHQAKVAKVQEACKRKLQEVHGAYTSAKRKFQDAMAERNQLAADNQELQQKYAEKAAQVRGTLCIAQQPCTQSLTRALSWCRRRGRLRTCTRRRAALPLDFCKKIMESSNNCDRLSTQQAQQEIERLRTGGGTRRNPCEGGRPGVGGGLHLTTPRNLGPTRGPPGSGRVVRLRCFHHCQSRLALAGGHLLPSRRMPHHTSLWQVTTVHRKQVFLAPGQQGGFSPTLMNNQGALHARQHLMLQKRHKGYGELALSASASCPSLQVFSVTPTCSSKYRSSARFTCCHIFPHLRMCYDTYRTRKQYSIQTLQEW